MLIDDIQFITPFKLNKHYICNEMLVTWNDQGTLRMRFHRRFESQGEPVVALSRTISIY